MSTETKPKRDRHKVMRTKTDRGGKSLEMKKRTVKLSEEENFMLQYILDNKMSNNKKISMRDFFAAYIEEEYNKLMINNNK
jgi:hypothetical protein